jgi:hypothetical protein
MQQQVQGVKRFVAFLVAAVLLAVGFFIGPPEYFVSFAQMDVGLFFCYVTGQSVTDWVRAKNGSSSA